MKSCFVFFLTMVAVGSVPDNEVDKNLQLRIVVKYPDATLQAYKGSSLFIRGNGLGFSWNKGTKLHLTAEDTWTFNVLYKRSVQGFQCNNCDDKSFLLGNKFQYRILVDDTKDMNGANFAVQFPISATSAYFQDPPEFTVYPWFYYTNGSQHKLPVNSTFLSEKKFLSIYLPPSFNENGLKTYPVMIVLDMDPLISTVSWDNLQSPIYPYKVAEDYVLIGFGDYGKDRSDLLTYMVGNSLVCKNGTFENNCGGCFPDGLNDTELINLLREKCGKPEVVGGKGNDTLDFLLEEVVPTVNNQVFVENRLDISRLGIMGYSLGGLLACYAAWIRPHQFKYAICQSPSFWWPVNKDYTYANSDFINNILENQELWENRPEQKIYLDAGSEEEEPPFNLTQMTLTAAYKIASHEQFTMNKNLWLHISPGKEHSSSEWNRRLWKGLTAIFPAEGDPSMPESITPETNQGNSVLSFFLVWQIAILLII